ncbi:MAG TPA: serine protease [Chitinophagaceae bacterium]|nr:serine protease [Chitinophagaceae bacterium]
MKIILFKMQPLLHWMDLYQSNALDETTKRDLFEFLNKNTDAKDEWDELLALEQLLSEQGPRLAFQSKIKAIAEQKNTNKKRKSKWTPSLSNWKYAAAAATLLVVTSSLITWSIFSTNKSQHKHEYFQLRKEVESIKHSQNALIKNINDESKQATAWESKFSGTGFSIHADGYLVTNYHVVADAKEIMVEAQNGEHYPAYIIAFDNTSDIAILRIQDSTYVSHFEVLPYSLIPESASLAEPIFSLGYPMNSLVYHEGYISGEVGFSNQTDAYLLELTSDPGQSGAPIFNSQGDIVGMITGKQKNTQGKTYAIHMNNILNLLESLPEENKISLQQSHKLKNHNRPQQVSTLRDYIFAIKVN